MKKHEKHKKDTIKFSYEKSIKQGKIITKIQQNLLELDTDYLKAVAQTFRQDAILQLSTDENLLLNKTAETLDLFIKHIQLIKTVRIIKERIKRHGN